MSILEELYATGGTDVILNTLEIFSAAWPTPIVLVQDYVNHEITTEDDRVLLAEASAMAVALPKRDSSGSQNLTFALDGVRPRATQLLRQSMSAQEVVHLTHRVYVASDLSEPARQPYYLIVRTFKAEADHVEVTAGLFDLIDMKWPRDVYNSINAPGLKFMQ